MSTQPQVNVAALWKHIADQMKNQEMRPSLWHALEAARPLTIENDEFVIGFAGEAAPQAGILNENRYRNMMEQLLEAATRRRLRLRYISGDTLQDWDAEKARVAEAARLQEQSRQKIQLEQQAGTSWEAVTENLIRQWGELPGRSFASVQGRFLETAIAGLVEAYGRLMPAKPTEADERTYSRALERIGDRIGVPAAVIGYHVHLKLKKS